MSEFVVENFKVGDHVKCVSKEHVKLMRLLNHVLVVEQVIHSPKSLDFLKIQGIDQEFWAGWFRKLKKKTPFLPGDTVRYKGEIHKHLKDKVLTVHEVKHFNMDNDSYVLSFKDIPHHYITDHFEKAMEKANFPHIREVLTQLCNSNVVNEHSTISVHIVNPKLKEQGNYSKNDLMTVLRALEQYHVAADVLIRSTMDDALTIVITGEDIMEELGSNAPKTLPIEAILKLCDILECTMGISNHDFIYQIGYEGVIYYSQEICLPPVPAVNE